MYRSKQFRGFILAVFILFVFVPLACKWWGGNNNANNSNITATIREPEKYQATLLCSLDKGEDSTERPFTTVKVMKDGLSRRYDFKFDDSELSYMEGVIAADKSKSKKPEPFHYLIIPECKQYAEIRLDEVDIRIPGSLSPQEILATLQQQKNIEVLGDELINMREVTKYRYVDEKRGEGIVYLDKMTGLPVKAKVAAFVLDPKFPADDPTAQQKVLRVVVDIKDIAMTADAAQFQQPAGMTLTEPKDLCPQVKQIAATVTQFLWDSSTTKNK